MNHSEITGVVCKYDVLLTQNAMGIVIEAITANPNNTLPTLRKTGAAFGDCRRRAARVLPPDAVLRYGSAGIGASKICAPVLEATASVVELGGFLTDPYLLQTSGAWFGSDVDPLGPQ
jgi:hypothetical protein